MFNDLYNLKGRYDLVFNESNYKIGQHHFEYFTFQFLYN